VPSFGNPDSVESLFGHHISWPTDCDAAATFGRHDAMMAHTQMPHFDDAIPAHVELPALLESQFAQQLV
jgi:hypothetical protein